MAFALVNGARLAYDLAGEGPGLVFIHEGIADRHMWDGEVAALARDHRVLNLDLRDFGESDAPPGRAAWHEDVAVLMDRLGLADATIVAASFGARVALDVALGYPHLAGALVLMGPAVGGRSVPPETARQIDEIDALAARGDYDAAAEETLRLWLDGPSRSRGTVAGPIRDRLRRVNAEIARREQTVFAQMEPHALEPAAAGRLEEIAVPTLLIVGGDDVPYIQENARYLAAAIEGAELAVIEDAAHMPNVEHPERFAAVLRGFLARHDR